LNDETFGDVGAADKSLPKFFQGHGTTLLEELGQLGDEETNDVEDDILYESQDFGSGLPDFFKADYSHQVPNSVYDSWMGAATGEDLLEPLEDDDLDKELEQAQKELAMFALDPEMLAAPYQPSATVTISRAPADSGAGSQTQKQTSAPPLESGRRISGKDFSSILSGKKPVPAPAASESQPAAAPPQPAPVPQVRPAEPTATSPAEVAPSLSGSIAPSLFPAAPAGAIVQPLSSQGPWNKPLPNFDSAPAGRGPRPGRGDWPGPARGRGGRGGPFAHVAPAMPPGPFPGRPMIAPGVGPSPFPMGPPPHLHGPPPFGPPAFPFPPGGPPPMMHPGAPGGPPRFPADAHRGPPFVHGGPPPMAPPPPGHFGPKGGLKMSASEVRLVLFMCLSVSTTEMSDDFGVFRFVLDKVFEPMHTTDPYSDDFYAMQVSSVMRPIIEVHPLAVCVYLYLVCDQEEQRASRPCSEEQRPQPTSASTCKNEIAVLRSGLHWRFLY
jgi:hypothetical protein